MEKEVLEGGGEDELMDRWIDIVSIMNVWWTLKYDNKITHIEYIILYNVIRKIENNH